MEDMRIEMRTGQEKISQEVKDEVGKLRKYMQTNFADVDAKIEAVSQKV